MVKAATFIRATLHRYSAFACVQRNLKLADMMIGAAHFSVRQEADDRYWNNLFRRLGCDG